MNRQIDELDLISLLGTILGILNYNENLSQSEFSEEMDNKTRDIHNHLLEQDKKIDRILEVLNCNETD